MSATALRLPRHGTLLMRLGAVQMALGVLLWIRVGAEQSLLPYPLGYDSLSLLVEFVIALVLVIGGAGLFTGNPWGLRWSSLAGGALYVHSVHALRMTLRDSVALLRRPGALSEGLTLAVTSHCCQSIVALLVSTAVLWILLHECRDLAGRRIRLGSAAIAAAGVLALHTALRMLHPDDRC